MMTVDHVGVHLTHCCSIHGCKYGDPDCPVETLAMDTDYICEDCWDWDDRDLPTVEESNTWWNLLTDGQKQRIHNEHKHLKVRE